MTPLCSSKFTIGKPSNESLSLSRFLTRTVLKCVVLPSPRPRPTPPRDRVLA